MNSRERGKIAEEGGEKRMRIGSINLQKGIDNKIMEIGNALDRLEIDILFTQEWGGWSNEEGKYRNCIEGYTNLMSFKKLPERRKDNISMLAMTKKEREIYKRELYKKRGRRKGTTILVRNELVNRMNVNDLKIRKDGEIMAIELTIEKERWILINIHAEPEREKFKKERFFKKVNTIIENNIGKGNILIGGDANSIWEEEDTSNEQGDGDRTVKEWCEEWNMVDLMREKRKGEDDKGNWHTWESNSGEYSKRLDSFWGKAEWLQRIRKVETLQREIIHSDHKLVYIELEINEEIERMEGFEKEGNKTNNKQRCEKMKEEDWNAYRKIIKEEIEKAKIKDAGGIDMKVNLIGKIMNEGLRRVFEGKGKEEEIEEVEVEIGKEDFNWEAFKNENYKRGQEKKKRKLPKYTDGRTAKLIKGKHRLLTACKMINKVLKGKQEWNNGNTKWMEKVKNFHVSLKFEDIKEKKEMERVGKNAKKLANEMSSEIYKRRKKSRDKEWKIFAQNLEEEGWKGSKKFFDKIMRKRKERISIRKIPAKYLIGEEKEGDPNAIKRMIADFWEGLYKKDEKINENLGKGNEREWFETGKWKEHREKIRKNEKIRNLTREIENEELEIIIKRLKNGKMGGPDEIMNEQIKFGPRELWKELRNILNEIIENEYIPAEWKRIRVTLIHKKEDTNDPDKYRGISLSSALYKILAKILAKRIVNIAEETGLIGESQGLGKLGMSSIDQARILWNIIEDADENDTNLSICYIDMEKAYDRVEWGALEEVLTETGLPDNLIRLIMDLNTNLRVVVESDFGLTRTIEVGRGIRQGCPLSPIIFCLFIEPMLRWLEEGEEGYRMRDGRLKIPDLAYMDDIVLINSNREETRHQSKKVEKYCNEYGLKISDKTVFTERKTEEGEEELVIQNNKIKRLLKEEAYKYLGFWMTLDRNWKKHKEEIAKKHTNLIGMAGIKGIDPRIQFKIVNLVLNTAVEYGFHLVTYTKKELDKIDIQNKGLIKRILKISRQCPSSSIFVEMSKGGIGIRRVKDTYKEIGISDLYNTINFKKEDSWSLQTLRQRFLTVREYIEKRKSRKIGEKKSWIETIWKIMRKEGMEIINNKWEGMGINSDRIKKIAWKEIEEIRGIKGKIKNIIYKWEVVEGMNDFREIVDLKERKMKSRDQLLTERKWRKIDIEDWEEIRRWLEEGEDKIDKRIMNLIEEKGKKRSMFRSDWEMIGKGRKYTEKEEFEIYTDGSESNGKAGLGVWTKNRKDMKFSGKVFGNQTSYEGEIQATVYAVCNACEGGKNVVLIDNESVRNLNQKLNEGKYTNLEKCPNPEMARLLSNLLEKKKELQTKFQFVKVKGHSGIEGNEKADKLAKKGREREITYLTEEDMTEYVNKIEIKWGEKKISSNCRKEVKKHDMEIIHIEAQNDRNEEWRNFINIEKDEKETNKIMKDRKIKKNIFEFIFKGRTGMLPHAKNLLNRGTENIWTSGCPNCGKIEDTKHILVDCGAYEKERDRIEEKVVGALERGLGRKREEIKREIPGWFRKKEGDDREDFECVAGMLGGIPKALKRKIKELLKEKIIDERKRARKTSRIMNRVRRTIVEGAWIIWKKRNEVWKEWSEKRNRKEEINLRGMIQRIRPQNKPLRIQQVETRESVEIIPIRSKTNGKVTKTRKKTENREQRKKEREKKEKRAKEKKNVEREFESRSKKGCEKKRGNKSKNLRDKKMCNKEGKKDTKKGKKEVRRRSERIKARRNLKEKEEREEKEKRKKKEKARKKEKKGREENESRKGKKRKLELENIPNKKGKITNEERKTRKRKGEEEEEKLEEGREVKEGSRRGSNKRKKR